MEQFCAVCGAKAPRRCASCNSVSYCSGEHQKEHWKVHRRICPNFKIVEDSHLGKGVVATRDLKACTVILDEEPVAVGPSESPRLSCLTCGLAEEPFMLSRRCSRCKWPVCSVDCENHIIHAENECRIFSSGKITYSPVSTWGYFADLVMGIRVCLLKKNAPQLYQQVLGLCSEFSLPNQDTAGPIQSNTHLRELLGRVQDLNIDLEEIYKLLRIFRINCFSGSIEEEPTSCNPDSFRYVNVLYLKSSRINHSCIPNCHVEIGSMPDFKIRIRTTRPVSKGEPLTIFYWMGHIGEHTKLRQEIIRKKGFFRCECPRCKDPTELGTYRSAIVCQNCQRNNALGYFLPEDPLDVGPDAKWKCIFCQDIKLAGNISRQVEKFQQRISKMQEEFGCNPHDDRFIEFCKRFVSKTSGIFLHPNHWVIQSAITVAGEYLMLYRQTSMSLDFCMYFVKCWKQLLSIQDVLTPGITYTRATTQVELAFALHFQCAELLSLRKYKQVERNYEECLVLLKEALKFFSNELPTAERVVTNACTIEKKIDEVLVDRSAFHLKLSRISGSEKE